MQGEIKNLRSQVKSMMLVPRRLVLLLGIVLGIPYVCPAFGQQWGVYAEKTNAGNDLSCWVCTAASAGTATCLGNKLIPDTQWNTREQAGAAACVLARRGKCL